MSLHRVVAPARRRRSASTPNRVAPQSGLMQPEIGSKRSHRQCRMSMATENCTSSASITSIGVSPQPAMSRSSVWVVQATLTPESVPMPIVIPASRLRARLRHCSSNRSSGPCASSRSACARRLSTSNDGTVSLSQGRSSSRTGEPGRFGMVQTSGYSRTSAMYSSSMSRSRTVCAKPSTPARSRPFSAFPWWT